MTDLLVKAHLQLQDALDADDSSETEYHVRQAQQTLVLLGEDQDLDSALIQ